VTSDAVDCRVVGVVDDHLYGGAGGANRVAITAGVMTGGAVIAMGGQNIRPVLDRVAVGARFVINHAQIGCRVDLHRMVNAAASAAVVMAGKGASVAALAFAAASDGRADAGSRGGRMAGQATIDGMNLAGPDEWGAYGAMATHAIGRGWGGGDIDLDRGAMAMSMGVEVSAMTLDAGAAHAAVDGGVTIDTSSAIAVQRVMAGGA